MAISEHAIQELDRSGLRRFGLTFGGIVAGIFGVLLPWFFRSPSEPWPAWPWAVMLVMAAWALVAPVSLRPVYRLWMHFGLTMSRITTPLIMGVVFFTLITPVAIIFKILRRDAMARKLDSSKNSYRVGSVKAPPDNLRRPF